jgi:hypothetical protein
MKPLAALVSLVIFLAVPAFASHPKVKHPQAVHPQNPYLKHKGHYNYKYKAPHTHAHHAKV